MRLFIFLSCVSKFGHIEFIWSFKSKYYIIPPGDFLFNPGVIY